MAGLLGYIAYTYKYFIFNHMIRVNNQLRISENSTRGISRVFEFWANA